jgi:osmotically-inducible protein OsmY
MSDDEHLKPAVLDELKWEPSINAANFGVTAKDGVVTPMGHVETHHEKQVAKAAALRVKAVKAVTEEIEVKLPFSVKHGDQEIAEAAIDGLAWNVSRPERCHQGRGVQRLGDADGAGGMALSA